VWRDREDLSDAGAHVRQLQRKAPQKARVLKSVLIDSDVLIEVSRAKDTAILAKWDDLSRGNTALLRLPVTVAELWHGARQTEHKIS